jgi:hypothetical protein
MSDAAKCEKCGGDLPPEGVCARCALSAAMPAGEAGPRAEDVAAKLPAFDVLGVLGRGGMGVVFKARQKALDRIVALKVLPPAAATAPGFVDRFQREAKAMARLAHPNIVAVHDFGEADGLCYLVLEYVDGVNVREAMSAGRVGPKEALTIVPQICDALQYAHDRGVVHRDIKPENVLIDRDGRVKIADFGLAKLADRDTGEPSLTGAGQVMGTLRYMAPEQWERPKEVDHRADIYSLGVVFYEMLTGELPMGKFEPPSKKASVDVRIDEVVMRAVERDRERRWQRADDVKSRVTVVTDAGPAAAPTKERPRAAKFVAAAAARERERGEEAERRSHARFLATNFGPFVVAGALGAVATEFSRRGLPHWSQWFMERSIAFLGAIVAYLAVPRIAVATQLDRLLAPLAPWKDALPARVAALVIAATVVLAAAPFVHNAPDVWSAAIFLAGVALLVRVWWSIDRLRRARRDGTSARVGVVGVECVALCALFVGLLGVGWGEHPPFGEIPDYPVDAFKKPWTFVVNTPPGEDPSHLPDEQSRQDLWTTWTKAQVLQGGEWNAEFRDLYDPDDAARLSKMDDDARRRAAASGTLGAPLLPKDATALADFRIRSVAFYGWDGWFRSARVDATDHAVKRTLAFDMKCIGVAVGGGNQWRFVVASAEVR